MSARIRGHSRSSERRAARSCPIAPIRQKWNGVLSRSSERTCRRTSAAKSGEPLAGASLSVGIGCPASNRSRTYQAIPPHSPAAASPIPTQRGSNGPIFNVGPGGKRFAKRSPRVLGRNPGTALESAIG
jgi:hypothetical protein